MIISVTFKKCKKKIWPYVFLAIILDNLYRLWQLVNDVKSNLNHLMKGQLVLFCLTEASTRSNNRSNEACKAIS